MSDQIPGDIPAGVEFPLWGLSSPIDTIPTSPPTESYRAPPAFTPFGPILATQASFNQPELRSNYFLQGQSVTISPSMQHVLPANNLFLFPSTFSSASSLPLVQPQPTSRILPSVKNSQPELAQPFAPTRLGPVVSDEARRDRKREDL